MSILNACDNNDLERIERYIKERLGDDVENVLLYSAHNGYSDVCDLLLQKSLILYNTKLVGLLSAVLNKQYSTVRIFLKHSSNLDIEELGIITILCQDLEMLKIFLEYSVTSPEIILEKLQDNYFSQRLFDYIIQLVDASKVKVQNFTQVNNYFMLMIQKSSANWIDLPKTSDNKLEWWGQDVDENAKENSEDSENSNSEELVAKDLAYKIYLFGRTESGSSVKVVANGFEPFYYIKLQKGIEPKRALMVLKNYIKEKFWMCNTKYYVSPFLEQKCCVVKAKDLNIFTNGEQDNFIKVVFKSKMGLQCSKKLFKQQIQLKGLTNGNVKMKLYESNFEPFLRYAHIQNIKLAGWVEIKGYPSTDKAKISVSINHRNLVGIDLQKIAPFVQFSWDIEVYSHSRDFPLADYCINRSTGHEIKRNKYEKQTEDNLLKWIESSKNQGGYFPNEVYQIGITLKTFSQEPIKRILLCNKPCEPFEGTELQVLKTERDLLIKFVKLVQQYDPDVLYGYNTDSFDFDYVVKRCRILGILEYFYSGVSRHRDIPCFSKKEIFSSGAYGDSEYNRVYIPGRLNYDLLIHYKRGMVKYASYKLDNIAKEILGDQKNDMNMNDLFRSFESGTPEEVRTVAEYCVQDTELLQRLVDKQLILVNAIQMANVTSVPVGYLLVKGQTIKVLSQIMKKSRELGYLVPHTNFNNDTNFLNIQFKDPIDTEEFDLYKGYYIQMDFGKRDYEWEDRVLQKQLIVSGVITNIIDNKTIQIKTDHQLEEEEQTLKFAKTCVVQLDNNKVINLTKNFKQLVLEQGSEVGFTGACVLDPIVGITNQDVVVLDFASLYPTVMISRNLCMSTLLTEDSEYNEERLKEQGIKYEIIEWDDTVQINLNKKCSNIMNGGKRIGEVCTNDANFKVGGYHEYYCDLHKTEESIESPEQRCEKEILHKTKKQEKVKVCNKLGKWTDGIFVYCQTCKQKEEQKQDCDPIEQRKCKICKKKATWSLFVEEERYFCKTHDPLKKERGPEEKNLTQDIHYRFIVVQPQDGKNKGVVPQLLEELYTERKLVKKQMYKTTDTNLKNLLDMQQLAIKVSLNSVYGFMGRTRGNLIKSELGKITTAVGRELIHTTKRFVEEEFKTKGVIKDTVQVVELNNQQKQEIKSVYGI